MDSFIDFIFTGFPYCYCCTFLNLTLLRINDTSNKCNIVAIGLNIQKNVVLPLNTKKNGYDSCVGLISCLYPQIYQVEMHTGKKAGVIFPAEQFHMILGNNHLWKTYGLEL